MGRKIFITGIGTGIGKTVVSAIVVEALGAHYWKPVQAGIQPPTDAQQVQQLLSNPQCAIIPERYLLETPVSPHLAARLEHKQILLDEIPLPAVDGDLVIEGAGGVYSPINDTQQNIDMIVAFKAEVIIVVRHYLGSINHSLLTIEALKNRNIPILGIVFNGINDASTDYIMQYSGLPNLLQLEEKILIDKKWIRNAADQFLQNRKDAC